MSKRNIVMTGKATSKPFIENPKPQHYPVIEHPYVVALDKRLLQTDYSIKRVQTILNELKHGSNPNPYAHSHINTTAICNLAWSIARSYTSFPFFWKSTSVDDINVLNDLDFRAVYGVVDTSRFCCMTCCLAVTKLNPTFDSFQTYSTLMNKQAEFCLLLKSKSYTN